MKLPPRRILDADCQGKTSDRFGRLEDMEVLVTEAAKEEFEPVAMDENTRCPFCGKRDLGWDSRLREWYCEECDTLVTPSLFFF
jgi:ribosomal protein L37AE/L43A